MVQYQIATAFGPKIRNIPNTAGIPIEILIGTTITSKIGVLLNIIIPFSYANHCYWCTRRDSNPRPTGSKPATLSN